MSKSPKLRGPKLHSECYTSSPTHEHSFLNNKKSFDIKLVLNYCAVKGIKPPLDEINNFDDLHNKAKQTVISININILSSKKALEKNSESKKSSEKNTRPKSNVKKSSPRK